VSFRGVSFRGVSFRAVSFRGVSFRAVSFRAVPSTTKDVWYSLSPTPVNFSVIACPAWAATLYVCCSQPEAWLRLARYERGPTSRRSAEHPAVLRFPHPQATPMTY
jgi:hypothetical protein